MAARKGWLAVGLVALVAVVVAAVAGVSGAANPNKLVVTLEANPGPAAVTYGGNVAFTLDIVNASNNPWNKVIATIPAPSTGQDSTAILKHLVCPGVIVSGEEETSEDIVCDLGTLAPQAAPSLFFVWQMPSEGSDCTGNEPSCVDVVATVTGKEGTSAPDSPKSKGREDAFPDSLEIGLLDSLDTDKRDAATYALDACDDPDTPTLVTNEDLSATNPIQTQVCIPSVPGLTLNPGHAVVLHERDRGPTDVGGRSPQISDICIPALGEICDGGHTPFSFDDPETLEIETATFTFVVRNKSITGQIDEVFENGAVVSFDPDVDPHVVSITPDPPSGTTTIVVESSDNGGWDFG